MAPSPLNYAVTSRIPPQGSASILGPLIIHASITGNLLLTALSANYNYLDCTKSDNAVNYQSVSMQ